MMAELRWLLIIIGIVIIIAVYAYSRYQHHIKNEKEFSRTPPPGDPLAPPTDEKKKDVDDIPSLHIQATAKKPNDKTLLETIKSISIKAKAPETSRPPPKHPERDKPTLLILHVWARSGQYWQGNQLMDVAAKAGLKATDKNIFQYFHQNNSTTPLFHVADKNEPGTFEWHQIEQYKTQGVSLFMELPVFCSAVEAFLLMHACAQRFAKLLDGEIRDQAHKPIEQKTIDEMHQLCRTIDNERGHT